MWTKIPGCWPRNRTLNGDEVTSHTREAGSAGPKDNKVVEVKAKEAGMSRCGFFVLLAMLFAFVTPWPVSAQMQEQWVARYDNNNGDDRATAIAVDAAGNVYVTGTSSAPLPVNYDYATVKYDSNGNQLWVARYDGPAGLADSATAIAVDTAGNVYVTGWSSGGFATDLDYATIKYDTNGNQLWVARYSGPGNGEDRATSIAVDAGGNVYVTGFSWGNGVRQTMPRSSTTQMAINFGYVATMGHSITRTGPQPSL